MEYKSSNGPGLFTLLTVLFVGLKLTGHIDWSWLWVFSPIFIGFSVLVLLILIVTLFEVIFESV